MADTLPTKEELEQLYHKKGKEALVWYAWRNALRALPLLGGWSLKKIWKEDTVKHVFSVCRVSLLMANIPTTVILARHFDAAYAAYSAADVVAVANTTCAAAAAAAANDEAATAYAAYAAAVADVDEARGAARDAARAAARADYKFIINNTHNAEAFWFSQPLWQKKGLGSLGSLKPKDFDANLSQLFAELKTLGLEFLANDLELIYQGVERPEQKHWKQYLETPSDVVFESAESLRRFIFEESEQINAVRVLLLGPGGASKTTLKDRLQGETDVKHHKATVGIEYL
ncbi:MAG: hypothetical protein KAH03_03705, partial [Cocleimonas sp.]|nr:hypothetical protein [Cocleimonas sp.]